MNKFLKYFGVDETEWEPRAAMHPQYNLKVHNGQKETVRDILDNISIGKRKLSFREKEGGFFSIDLGHKNLSDDFLEYQNQKVPFNEVGLENLKLDDETGSTAYHIPEGSLFIYDPQNTDIKKHRTKGVTTLAFVPSVLENFNVPVMGYMSDKRIPDLTN